MVAEIEGSAHTIPYLSGKFHTGVRSHLGKQAPTLLISRERIEKILIAPRQRSSGLPLTVKRRQEQQS